MTKNNIPLIIKKPFKMPDHPDRGGVSLLSCYWLSLRERKWTFFLLLLLLLLTAALFLAPFIFSLNIRSADTTKILPTSGAENQLGHDLYGHDTPARLVFACLEMITTITCVVSSALFIALLLALTAVITKWRPVIAVIRLCHLLSILPPIVQLALLMEILPEGYFSFIAALTVTVLGRVASLSHERVAAICRQGYILNARLNGCSWPAILFRHVAPNLPPIIIFMVSTVTPSVIVNSTILAYLGYVDSAAPAVHLGEIIARAVSPGYYSLSQLIYPVATLFIILLTAHYLGREARAIITRVTTEFTRQNSHQ